MSQPESNKKDNAEGSLLWECFANWAATLEKLEKEQRAMH
jgi:hypothetical protein